MISNFSDFLKKSRIDESTYVVQKGDTLSSISKKLGFDSWKELYDLNKDVIGKNPDSLRKGMELKSSESKSVEPVKNLFSKDLKPKEEEADKDVKVVVKNAETKGTYKKWEDLKAIKNKINAMAPSEIIKQYHKEKGGKYLILDKSQSKMRLYDGDKEISTFRVGVGENIGDKQTATVVRDGKVYWEEGNKMTGAGIYSVSKLNPSNEYYYDVPSWVFKNEKGMEIPMAIHSALKDRIEKIKEGEPEEKRISNGCINGLEEELKELYKSGYKEGDLLYVLPEDPKNYFEISNGKLIFRSKDPEVNSTVQTLNYKPIRIDFDETTFTNDVFQALDFNDEEELENTTKPFIKTLQDSKKKVMEAAKINGDVYNDIAKIAFGIYGTESNFGDTHSMVGNVLRAGAKFLRPSSSSSPDYLAKATLFGKSGEENSVGLTQIRFNQLDASEKEILTELGITNNMQLLTPQGSALATLGILAARYRNQLTPEQKKDPMANLPKKWNVRANYPDRVKSNSKYITINELT